MISTPGMSKLCLVVCLLGPLAAVQAGRMEVLYSWSQVDFIFPEDRPRETFISSKEFIPSNNIILDVDVWKEKVFVTLPQLKEGVPVTLATVSDQTSDGSRLLEPYPDWSWHQGDCDGLASVFRTQVDECGRLWVIDSGLKPGGLEKQCPPKILVFDLHTNKLIRRHRFPDSVLGGTNTLMITIKVDSRTTDCSDSFAYVADVQAFQLFVYDFAQDKSWRIVNNLFYPYPLYGHLHIIDQKFDLMDGVFGLALGPITKGGDRTLYFHSLASVRESWVSTSVIRNHSLFETNPGASPKSFHVSTGTRPSQSASQDMTDSAVMLFSMVVDHSIGCWNTRKPFTKRNLDTIAKDDGTLQFQSGLKVYGDKVWTLSSRYHNFVMDQVPDDEVNYRVNVGQVSALLKNTRCDPRKQRRPGQHLFKVDC